ncbi:hypothetical protein ACFYYH_03380 [Streptomyces sp. NPDC002018]|uniref:hypothetical protein n=1 Tax=Streptomyces sp. NPDC002018 TaxID=3364629 RepID=UPI0036B26B7B
MNAVSESYLRAAAEAGLLDRFAGSPYVAGAYEEPVRCELQYLVTYCDPDLAARPSWWAELPALARAAAPAAQAVVARLPSDLRPPAAWRRYLTYLSYHGADRSPAESGAPAPDLPEVVPALPEHDGPIGRWLGMALSNAAAAHGAERARPEEAVVKSLLEHPGRSSFVVLFGGSPAGHATVLCGEEDDVTGEPIAELFDILVEVPSADRPRATAALVAAAARHAAARRLPLIGNVVHTLVGESDPGEQVLASLTSRGWSHHHTMWWLPLDASAGTASSSSTGEDAAR